MKSNLYSGRIVLLTFTIFVSFILTTSVSFALPGGQPFDELSKEIQEVDVKVEAVKAEVVNVKDKVEINRVEIVDVKDKVEINRVKIVEVKEQVDAIDEGFVLQEELDQEIADRIEGDTIIQEQLDNVITYGPNELYLTTNKDTFYIGSDEDGDGLRATLEFGTDGTSRMHLLENGDLEVDGNILFRRVDKPLYAIGAEEPVRIIRGSVDHLGNKVGGEEFTSKRVDEGVYEITFDRSFPLGDVPIIVVTAVSDPIVVPKFGMVGYADNNDFVVHIFSVGGASIHRDEKFSFIVAGSNRIIP